MGHEGLNVSYRSAERERERDRDRDRDREPAGL